MSRLKINFGIALYLIACTGSHAEEPLKIALNSGSAPYHFVGPDGKVKGYTIDIIDLITARLKRDYIIVDVELSAQIAGVNSGLYDWVAAFNQVTPQRGKSVLFSENIVEANMGIVTLANVKEEIHSIEHLRGKSIAVNRGSVYDHWFSQRAGENGWTVMRYGKMSDAIQSVLSGRDFAVAAGDQALAYAAQQNSHLRVAFTRPTGATYAYMFGLSNEALRGQVEEALECLKASGDIARIHEKWTGSKPLSGGIAYTPQPGFGVEGTYGFNSKSHTMYCDI